MTRQRPNAPEPGERARRRAPGPAPSELDLTDEDVRALVDEGVDPDEVQRLSRERRDPIEASDHDRDTARDDLEGLERENTDY